MLGNNHGAVAGFGYSHNCSFYLTEGGSLTPVRDGPCTPRLRSVSSYGNIRAVTTARNLNKSLQNLSLNEECKRHFRILPFFMPLVPARKHHVQDSTGWNWHFSPNYPAPRAWMRSPLIISCNFLVISIDFSECLGTKNVPSSFQA